MKKTLVFICLILFSLGITAYASNSLTIQQLATEEMISYGRYKDYAPPLGIAPSENEQIDTMGGSLTRVETDLVLPGKNGLDFAVQRKYNNQRTDKRFIQQSNTTLYLDRIAYKYSYVENNTTKYIYIGFISEEDMLEKAPGTVQLRDNYLASPSSYSIFRKNVGGTYYYFFKDSIIYNSGTVTATRVANADPYIYDITCSNAVFDDPYDIYTNYNLGYNWEIIVPRINIEMACMPTTGWQHTLIDDRRVSELCLENGAVYSLYTMVMHEEDTAQYTFTENIAYAIDGGDMFLFEHDPYGDYKHETLNGVTIDYSLKMTDKNSVNYYFTKKGFLRAKADKYGNAILYYPQTGNTNLLDYVIDTYGRRIQFVYSQNKIVAVEVYMGNTLLNKIEYSATYINDSNIDPNDKLSSDNDYVLTVKKWEDDSFIAGDALITTYEHERVPIYRRVKNSTNVYNVYDTDYSYNLKKITYPTSLQTEYEYEQMQKYMYTTVGKITVYKVSSRKDTENNTDKNEYTYTYTQGSGLHEGAEPPSSYNKNHVYTCVAERTADGLTQTDEYDKYCKQNSKLVSATGYKCLEKYKYGSVVKNTDIVLDDVLVEKRTMYGEDEVLGDSCYLEHYAYDIRGNITERVETPYIDGKYYVEPDNADKITYEYDSAYNMLVSEKHQLNDTQWYLLQNTLSQDGKNVVTSKEYEGVNDADYTEKTSASYTYDGCGNIASITAGNSTKQITHTYNADGTMTLTESGTNLTDADGVTISNVTTVTVYDALGRATSKTDGNGNETEVYYDLLNRVTGTENPDSTTTQNEYDTANNILIATDEGGRQVKLCYNAFGQLSSAYIKVSNAWKKVEEYEYDGLSRAVAETKTSAYDSGGNAAEQVRYEYEFYPFDMVKKVTKKDKNGTTVNEDNYTYDFSSTSGDYLSDLPFLSGSMSRDTYLTIYGYTHLIDSDGGINLSKYVKTDFEKGLSAVSGSVKFDAGKYCRLYGKLNRNATNYTNQSSTFDIYKDSETTPEETHTVYCSQEDPYVLIDLDVSDHESVKLKVTKNNNNYTYRTAFADAALLTRHDYLNGAGENYVRVTKVGTPKDGITPPTSVVFYNRRGQAVKERITDGNDTYISTYLYDRAGRLTEVRDSKAYDEDRDYSEKYEYDALGNIIKEYNANGDYKQKTYDTLNRLTSETDYMSNATTYTYDGLGRLIKTEAPVDTGVTSMVKSYYDGNGNVISTKTKNDTNSFRTETATYDCMNRPIFVKNGAGEGVQYTYDNLGNITRKYTGLTSPTDTSVTYNPQTSSYAMTSYTYDALGYLSSVTDAMGNTETYTNDISGKVTAKTDRNGDDTDYAYDSLSRLSGYTNDDGTVSYGYDAFDNLKYTSGCYGGTTYSYDNFCRLISETRDGYTKTYTYDGAGNRASMTLSDTNNTIQSASYSYDSLNRLTSYTSGNVTAAYTYNANGLITQYTRNGDRNTCSYTVGGLPRVMVLRSGTSYLDYLEYSYYPDGNVKTYDDDNTERTYTYDGAGRLTEVSVNNTQYEFYYYDIFGNRTHNIAVSYIQPNNNIHYWYEYDKNNRLISMEDGNSGGAIYSYSYDLNGNQLTETETILGVTQSSTTNTYDAQNRLETISRTANNNTDVISYTYDAEGLRQTKTVNNVTTRHIWDGTDIIADIGADTTLYHRGADLIAKETGNSTENYRLNGHGDVVMLGSNSYEYDAFGNQLNSNANDTNPFRYCGEYFDTETNQIYLRARYYRPQSGRFITEDPIRDGLNWYVYCGNNPVMFVDPSGNIRKPGYVNGVWCENPDAYEFGKNSDTYKILVDLGNKWLNTTNNEDRNMLSNMANKARRLHRAGTPLKYGQNIVMDTLHNNAELGKEYIEMSNGFLTLGVSIKSPYEWFVLQTCNDWDYKTKSGWQVPYDTFNGENMNINNAKNWTPWIYFDGMIISGDKFGNINLGYVGTKMGFSGVWIENKFTLDKDDGPYVKYGITMAKQGR
ncbi:MAG: RHS repeat-associated core domain-containing protein [Clostridia bacterium]|nr:RHS repeat-associated core domain-containing protein [Clostridia bacterium]